MGGKLPIAILHPSLFARPFASPVIVRGRKRDGKRFNCQPRQETTRRHHRWLFRYSPLTASNNPFNACELAAMSKLPMVSMYSHERAPS